MFLRVQSQMRPLQLNIMVFCPEHPKRDQNLKFTLISETTSIPASFIWKSPPPREGAVASPLPSKFHNFVG